MGTKSVGFDLVYNRLCRVFQGQLLIYLGWYAKFDEPISSLVAQYVNMILILLVSLERKQFSKLFTMYISVHSCRFSVYCALHKSDSCFFVVKIIHHCFHFCLFAFYHISAAHQNPILIQTNESQGRRIKINQKGMGALLWKRKLLFFHHHSLSRSSIPPQIILLWTSLIREHQKYFWNVTVLPLNPQTAMVIGLGLCGLPACSLLDLMVIGHYTVNIAEIFQTFTVFWVWRVVNWLLEN